MPKRMRRPGLAPASVAWIVTLVAAIGPARADRPAPDPATPAGGVAADADESPEEDEASEDDGEEPMEDEEGASPFSFPGFVPSEPGDFFHDGARLRFEPDEADRISAMTQELSTRIAALRQARDAVTSELAGLERERRARVEAEFGAEQWRQLAAHRRESLVQRHDDRSAETAAIRLLARVAASRGLAVFEGLPRSVARDEVARLAEKDEVFAADGHWFRREPVPCDERLAARITATWADADALIPHRPGKMCGGFHPDLRLVFDAEPDEVELLVCFGCDEVRIRNAEMSLVFDLTVEAARHFRSVANGLWPDREPMDW